MFVFSSVDGIDEWMTTRGRCHDYLNRTFVRTKLQKSNPLCLRISWRWEKGNLLQQSVNKIRHLVDSAHISSFSGFRFVLVAPCAFVSIDLMFQFVEFHEIINRFVSLMPLFSWFKFLMHPLTHIGNIRTIYFTIFEHSIESFVHWTRGTIIWKIHIAFYVLCINLQRERRLIKRLQSHRSMLLEERASSVFLCGRHPLAGVIIHK